MLLLLSGGLLAQICWRASQVALPLVALSATGSLWSSGLVGATSGVPVVLAPWWTRTLRQRVARPGAVGGLELSQAGVTLTLPLAAWSGRLTLLPLVLAGLGIGVTTALSVPARAALLADLGDARFGRSRACGAARMLAWQDAGTRLAMVVGPSVAGVLAALTSPSSVLLVDVFGCTMAGLLALAVTSPASAVPTPSAATVAPRIREVVRAVPDVARGWLIRGTGCVGWFAFSLGLPLLGAASGVGPRLAAVGFAAYGVGGVLGAALALRAVRWSRPILAASAGWAVGGLAFVAMGSSPTIEWVAVAAVCAGAAVPVGNATVTAVVTRRTSGPLRRTALAGQQTIVTATSTAGLLVGGPLIATVGVRASLVGSGGMIAAVALAATLTHARRRVLDTDPAASDKPTTRPT